MPDDQRTDVLAAPAAETLVFESDWLGTRPFFFNERTGAAGSCINDVIDLAALEFDPEGFNDYLDYGFCVFGRTPVRDVRLLRHSSRLWRTAAGGLRVEELPDVAEDWYDRHATVGEVLELAEAKLAAVAAGAGGELIVPTSGGLDSRFIDMLLSAHERDRLRTFTYGVSDDPSRSTEAMKAREVARRLGLRWELVPLGDFHRYLADWDELFGCATHAHGMYQIEFYRKIRALTGPGGTVVSGLCGEWFEGDDPEVRVIDELRTPEDLKVVFRYGRMVADSGHSRFRSEERGAWRLLEEQPRLRREMLPRVVQVVRLRMILLSYLLTVPRSLGFAAAAPLVDPDLALRLLVLPPELRKDRRWLRELYAARGLDVDRAAEGSDHRNTLNFQGMRRVPLPPLDDRLLREVVEPEYVRWVNRTVGPAGLPWELYWRAAWVPGLRRAVARLKRLGLRERRSEAYGAYLTLRPIQELLRRRDDARAAAS